MNTEEKAKTYNKVREKIALRFGSNVAEEIFSEFEMSEDEKVRKELIKHLRDGVEGYMPAGGSEDYARWIAWLEKQGESYTKRDVDNAFVEGMAYAKEELEKQSEHTDKVEPKFQNGQWIVWQNKCYKVNYNGCGYELIDQNGLSTSLEYGTVDASARLWDITKDARDGDVLYHKAENGIEYIVMSKGLNEHNNIDSYFRYNSINGFGIDIPSVLSAKYDSITPATKEQRDQLEKAMTNAGWEFDFEKKELKKISNALEECEIEHIEHGKYYYCIKDYYAGGNKRASKGDVVKALNGMHMMALGVEANEYFIPVKCIVDVRPAWSEEDMKEALRTEYEKGRADAIAEMKKPADVMDRDSIDNFTYQCAYDLSKDWLYENASWDDVQIACKLGAKWYEAHHKVQWSEEDEVKINRIVACLENLNVADNDILLKDVDWPKSLKDRVIPKPKHEWSIEDERTIAIINNALTESNTPPDDYDKVYDWLESLRQRIGG